MTTEVSRWKKWSPKPGDTFPEVYQYKRVGESGRWANGNNSGKTVVRGPVRNIFRIPDSQPSLDIDISYLLAKALKSRPDLRDQIDGLKARFAADVMALMEG